MLKRPFQPTTSSEGSTRGFVRPINSSELRGSRSTFLIARGYTLIASPKVEGLPRSIQPTAPLEVVDEPVQPLALLEVIVWQRSLRPFVSLEVI